MVTRPALKQYSATDKAATIPPSSLGSRDRSAAVRLASSDDAGVEEPRRGVDVPDTGAEMLGMTGPACARSEFRSGVLPFDPCLQMMNSVTR